MTDSIPIVPVLITFDRPGPLRATLEAFSQSAFKNGPFVVLDNASPAETEAVVRSFMDVWPGLRYQRNPYNVGGAANILRAVEATDSDYLWIIGDDDRWFLDDLEEVFRVLREGTADVVRLGWLVSEEHRGKTFTARELWERETMLFASFSMISATIVKRKHFIKHLPSAYSAAADAYPQLTPLLRAFSQEELSVYTLEKDIMLHTPSTVPGYFMHDLEWISYWFRNSRFLPDRRDRVRFVDNILYYLTRDNPSRLRENLYLFQRALVFKGYGVPQSKYLLSMLAYGDGRRLAVALTLLCYALIPGRLALVWDDWIRKHKGLPYGNARAVFAQRMKDRYARL